MVGRGALVVLEGCDRVGKTTQARLLVDSLNAMGCPAKYMNFPDRSTPIGGIINGYLKQTQELDDRAIHLLFSANRWEASKGMQAALQGGTTLIVDRYAYSGIAFSHAKGLPWAWCESSDAGLPKADLVLYLTLKEKECAGREGFGGERYEEEGMQARVRAAFEKFSSDGWKTVACDGLSIEELQTRLLADVQAAMADCKQAPLQTL